jgi:hypothetical protein
MLVNQSLMALPGAEKLIYSLIKFFKIAIAADTMLFYVGSEKQN